MTQIPKNKVVRDLNILYHNGKVRPGNVMTWHSKLVLVAVDTLKLKKEN